MTVATIRMRDFLKSSIRTLRPNNLTKGEGRIALSFDGVGDFSHKYSMLGTNKLKRRGACSEAKMVITLSKILILSVTPGFCVPSYPRATIMILSIFAFLSHLIRASFVG